MRVLEWVLTIALFALVLLACFGCDKIVTVLPPEQDAGVVVNDDLSTEEAEPSSRVGGRLPLGWNERGCQWDAPCDPPLNASGPLSDPIR